MTTLARELEPIHASLANNPTSLPVGPSLQVKGLDVRSCSFFTSFTTPLKLAFTSAEPEGSMPYQLHGYSHCNFFFWIWFIHS